MAVRHQVAGAFPSAHVARRNRPCGAGQVALAGEEFEIDRRAENREEAAPFLDLRELLDREFAREEKILRLDAETLHHVGLGGVIFVAGRDGVAVHVQRVQELEEVLDFLHLGLLVNGRVGRDLVAEHLRHAHRQHGLLEDAFALHDEVMRPLEAVEMHIPIHPLRRRDDGLLRVLRAFARLVGLRLRHEFLAHQHLRHRLGLDRVFYKKRREIVAHLLPHEHRVRADIDDPFALQ